MLGLAVYYKLNENIKINFKSEVILLFCHSDAECYAVAVGTGKARTLKPGRDDDEFYHQVAMLIV